MTQDNTSSRRTFLKGGALLTAPIVTATASAVALADEDLKARLRRLEDEVAIRELHQSWLRQVNAGDGHALLDKAVRRIIVDHGGVPDKIEIAADGGSAVGRFDHAVEVEAALPLDCTLAQMAHAQGNGTLHRTERRMLLVDYAKTGGTWKIAKVVLTTPQPEA
ncbi:MAG TPA: hypothetical protein VMU67_09105 [Steroidobacteraceae bacterium]|nr:hypothetical protein [Steroidobacteraceae bacterium]